jgi:predicted house-cleaning noncanonical NTP pyrophosphatase (MazG superfamily)
MSHTVTYNKLVRDLVPYNIAQAGDTCEVRQVTDDEEYVALLGNKVLEEAAELVATSDREAFIREYCDLMVALDTLTKHHEISEAEFALAMQSNVEQKGLYKKRNFLLSSTYTQS